MTILITYIAVWLLINLSHAAAHLIVARSFGVAVDRVSLGIGPSLWSRRRGRTTFRIALVPVAFLIRLRTRWDGEDDGVWPPSESTDLRSRHLGVRAAVFASAPTALLLLALVSAFFAAGLTRPEYDDRPFVGGVADGMPAREAGIQVGDLIVSIDGVKPDTWFDVVRLAGAASEGPLHLEIQRDQTLLTFDIEPQWSPIDDRPIIGIMPGTVTPPSPGLSARVNEALTTVAAHLKLFLQGFIPAPSPRELATVSGPIDIAVIAADRSGYAATFWFAATYFPLTCFSWCVVLPYLDGRRFLFLVIEAIARRPIHPKFEQRFNLIWLAVVVAINVIALAIQFLR